MDVEAVAPGSNPPVAFIPAIPSSDDSPAAVARSIEAIARIGSVPSILRLMCELTGMGFAAVARVTDGTWTACAVQDNIGFGVAVGGQLALDTTLCHEVRLGGKTIAFDKASDHAVYKDHHTPRIYGIESYVSIPIALKSGRYFGNLCAVDPRPARVSDPRVLLQMEMFADLIAAQLEHDDLFLASESALTDARAVSDLREHFIAVLGHDLRNPLSALVASTELLLRRSSEPDVVRIGKVMRSATRRMSALIDDVLDLARSRLGTGGIGARIVEVDHLDLSLREVVGELRTAFPGRAIDDRIVIDVPVECDRGRIQQLLSNLLGNAISHGAADQPVTIEAGVSDGWLEIAVTNGGEPMPPETLAKVFEPFWRPATSAPGGGLGLGLYICWEIAQAHGGTMQVVSNSECTRFSALLPIARKAG
ncbi:sensor histidine kinase [Xylophilus sp. Kf1]|nr:sensor histidine kinase [Xylophilus sp. Kf1]